MRRVAGAKVEGDGVEARDWRPKANICYGRPFVAVTACLEVHGEAAIINDPRTNGH